MNKLTKALIASFLLLVALLIVSPFAINTSSLKFQLEQKISQKLESNFEIKGAVKISFLPLPKVTANDVLISKLPFGDQYKSNVKIKRLIIRPAIFSLFQKNLRISKIIFDTPQIESVYNAEVEQNIDTIKEKKVENNKLTTPANISQLQTHSFANSLFNFESSENKIFNFNSIKAIEVIDGNLIKKDNNNQALLEFKKINFDLENNLKKQIFTIEGNFLSQQTPTQFQLIVNANKNKNSSIVVQSPIIQLSANGKFNNSDINNLTKSSFSGQLNAQIVDLKALLSKYFPKNNLFYGKINSTKPIKISANINDKEGEIKIENIIINSQLMDGVGQIQANFSTPKSNIDANFNFNNIDIDSIWFSGASTNNNSSSASFENEIAQSFVNKNESADENKTRLISEEGKTTSIFSNLDLTTEINIKTAKYLGANLQDMRLYFIVSDGGDVLLQPLTGKIPGNAGLKIIGTIKEENNIPKFVGEINVQGKNLDQTLSWLKIDLKNLKPNSISDYTFNSNLLLLPNFSIFGGLNLNVNNGKNIIVGDIKNDSSMATSNVVADLKVNYFNYDDYFQNNDQNQYLSGGSLLKKLLWLNTISSNRDISLFFNQLVYQNNSFVNQALKIKFGQGFLKINDFNLSSPSLDIKGDIEFDISKTTPRIDININSNNFTYRTQDSDLVDQFFNLPAIDEFSGKLEINIANLAVDNWRASDIKIGGDIKDGIVSLDNFTLKAYGGDVEYKGLIALKAVKTINGSLQMVGVSNQNLLNDIIGFKNISGTSNVSAAIDVSADKKSNFIKNLDAKAQFISSNITVNSFGIFDLARKMLRPIQYKQDLVEPLDILYNPNSQSFFTDARGAVNISGSKVQNFNIETSAVGMNGVISGALDLENQAVDGTANFIFISGTRQSQVPINIATSFAGKPGELKQNTNLTQVEQYLQSVGIRQ